jgi:hypothetical protein
VKIMKATRLFIAALTAALAWAAPHARAAAAETTTALGDGDRQCLACHAQSDHRRVDAEAFAKSVHAPLGCAACHADVDLKKHPGDVKASAGTREFSIKMAQACKGCHESSADAHARSVHGRDAATNAAAPLCVTCHGTHDIARASPALRETCLACHAEAAAQHAKWLPNTKAHFNVVACAACHAPSAGKRVELRFYDVKSKAEPVTESPVAAATDKPVDPAQLRAFVHAVEQGGGDDVLLTGRVEPLKPGEGHAIQPKSQAVKECSTCHRKGADPFQNVTLSIVGPDGTRTSYDAHKEVLSSPTSVDSVRGFYAMGGTRISALDIVLGLALVGGVSAPLGHFIVRRIMRRKEPRK